MEEPGDRIVMVSADGHVGPPIEAYRPYLEKRHHSALDELIRENEEWVGLVGGLGQASNPDVLPLIDEREAIRTGGESGAWDSSRRLAELEAEGIVAEVLFPGHQRITVPFFSSGNRPRSPELRDAGARAYNRWLAEFCAQAPGRRAGVIQCLSCTDVGEAVDEIVRAHADGLRVGEVPGRVLDTSVPTNCSDPYFEPIWTTYAELDLPVVAHAGWGMRQGDVFQLLDGGVESLMEHAAEGADIMWTSRSPLWQLMWGGVFDRHPTLRFALTEVRCDWVPAILGYLDRVHAANPNGLAMRPSEYWERHCFIGASSISRLEVQSRHDIGVRNLMFGADYPHVEGTWPNTSAWIQEAFNGVPEGEARLILGENAIRMYGFDRPALAALAQRVGPTVAEVLGGPTSVNDTLRGLLDQRGLAEAATPVDTAVLDRLLAGAAS